VLEGARIGLHAGDMHPGFVRERVAPHVRLIGIGGDVAELIDEVGGLGQ
jgi:hypothetical protein